MITHDDVRRLALALPGSFEHESYGGRPSFRTKARMFTWIRDDPDALVVWVDSLEDKEVLLASDPDVFFTIDHYNGHPIVLVHLEAVDLDQARQLIIDSFLVRAPKTLARQWRAANPEPEA